MNILAGSTITASTYNSPEQLPEIPHNIIEEHSKGKRTTQWLFQKQWTEPLSGKPIVGLWGIMHSSIFRWYNPVYFLDQDGYFGEVNLIPIFETGTYDGFMEKILNGEELPRYDLIAGPKVPLEDILPSLSRKRPPHNGLIYGR